MKIIFTDNELKNIYINQYSKYYNKEIINSYIKKIDQLKSMIDINDLYSFKSLNFEKLINYKK
jgi:plasmid maintenance system killer protein